MSDAQEMLARSVVAVMKQGCNAEEGGLGRYLTYDGKKCPIGHILTKDELDRLGRYEGTLDDMRDEGLLPERFKANFEMLYDLQLAHDDALNADFAREFWKLAEKVAKKHGLKMPGYNYV